MKRITKLLEEDELDIYAVKRDPAAKFALKLKTEFSHGVEKARWKI